LGTYPSSSERFAIHVCSYDSHVIGEPSFQTASGLIVKVTTVLSSTSSVVQSVR
jgi:hypothetical protein